MAEDSSRREIIDFAQFMKDLEAYLERSIGKAALVDPDGNSRAIPDEVFRALDQVVSALANGQGVTVAPNGLMMTTQQAADFLGVSRPTLVRLLEDGSIAFEKTNRHRRVMLRDLVEFQEASRRSRNAGLKELAQESRDSKVQFPDPGAVSRG